MLASGPWLGGMARWVERGLVAAAAAPLVAFAPVVTWALAVRARVVPLPGDPDAPLAGLLFAASLLAIPLAAHLGRIARAALADVARAQFLANGVRRSGASPRPRSRSSRPRVGRRASITTVVATQLGALLGGAVVLERMFERRGLGTLILEAYATRDLPVLEGAVVATGVLFVAAQAAGAAAHAAIDPRARSQT